MTIPDPSLKLTIDGEEVSLQELIELKKKVKGLTMQCEMLLESQLFFDECETRHEVNIRHAFRKFIGDVLALPKPEGEK